MIRAWHVAIVATILATLTIILPAVQSAADSLGQVTP
jgi:hypothetical protein